MSDTLVIVPALNEAENISSVIRDLASKKPGVDILVVNDASSDKTSEIALQTGLATVLDLPFNLGIGGAVQTGFKYAGRNGYRYALQFDGDGQHSAEEIDKLLKIVKSGEADIAIGSRFSRKHQGFRSSFVRRLGIRILEFFSYLLIRQRVTDHTSGFRAYNRKAIVFLAERYPADYPEPEVVILMGKNRFRIKEVFTQMHERQGGISSIPLAKGPYYMIKVMLAMFMASIRSKDYDHE